MGHGHVTPNPDGSRARCGGLPLCPECAQEAAAAGFYGAAGVPAHAFVDHQPGVCLLFTGPNQVCGAGRDDPVHQQPVRMTEAWDADKHPRAAKGSAGGGQFASLSYSAKNKTGSGYDKRSGDANVKRLQRALNRLKITDSHGKPLLVDGKLGPLTTSAVKKAQKALGLRADGKVTPELLSKLTGTRKLPEPGHARKTAKPTPAKVKAAAKTPAKGKTAKPTPATRKPVGRSSTTTRKPSMEAHLNEAGDAKKPYGDVEYADPGIQEDGKKRYPLSSEAKVRAAWSYINQAKNAAKYSAADLKKVKAKIRAAAKKLGIQTTEAAEKAVEAHVNGTMSFDDIREAVRKALQQRIVAETGQEYAWVYVADLTTTDVVYASQSDELFQCTYEISENAEVTLGDPEPVVRTYMPLTTAADGMDDGADTGSADAAQAMEAELVEDDDRIEGRVVEAKGKNESGGRVFGVRIIAYGDSKNRRRYPESVMRAAAPLYEGAKTYDHHRSEEELRSSTIAGLVGSYRNVEAEGDGLYADLHLLPSATHAAEALDASLAAQKQGLDPLVGVSHDVMATYKPLVADGRRMQEATAIVRVNSADVVADPAAGGKATRMVAGGEAEQTESGAVPAENEEEGDVPPTKDDILGALAEASDEELARVGLSRAAESHDTADHDPGRGAAEKATEATAAQPKGSYLAKLLIRGKVTDAGLPDTAVEAVSAALPDRITEADVDTQIAAMKGWIGEIEKAGLTPTAGNVTVTKEARDKKIEALDNFFAGKFSEGYHSFRQAFTDFTGRQPRHWGEDFSRTILRECFGGGFDAGIIRAEESMDSASWAQVLGDSVTRRVVAMYALPSLQSWRQITSSIVPVNDFRTQHVGRVGGYGTLPVVNEGAPYQPLTSPPDEESTYAIAKKGGTEDLTLEMVANDDVRAISGIPNKMGRAAAQTLYRFVWDFLRTNATATYDSTALFHANHANTDNPAVLSETTMSAGRVKMEQQTAYGDSSELLSLTPKFLVVPSNLETLAFKLVTSAVAVTSAEDATTPNIHQGMTPLRIDYFADANDWFMVADPALCPTLEIGFYLGKQEPEVFTQSDPNAGSVFSSDKFTYKIRHIYSGTILDHRGFYRGAN